MATYKDIEKANAAINTTTIARRDRKTGQMKSKEYSEVNQRIKAFRMIYPEGYINAEIIERDLTSGFVLMKATVGYYDESGANRILGVGTSFEWKNDPNSMVNKTSYIENCETSAVGRALGMCGIGIDTSIASADEVKRAQEHQEEMVSRPAPASKPKKAPASPTNEDKPIICQRCGKPIQPFGNNTPQQVANATMKSFGKVMCMDCGNATKAEQIAQEMAQNMVQDEKLQLPFPIED
jgi:hypothetical protein